MRKWMLIVLCVLLLCPRAQAQEPKYLTLTFDDGPSGRYTRALLDGLTARNVKATFFLCGYRVAEDPELTARIIGEGHEVGLHGYSHNSMEHMSRREIARELADLRALLPENCPVRFLRPPGGCCSDGVRQVAQAQGLAIAQWSIDPRDWATRDTAAIGRSVIDQVSDGDIILLHDMTMSSVRAALQIVDQLKARGFQFVTLTELARLRGAKLQPGQVYRKFPASES